LDPRLDPSAPPSVARAQRARNLARPARAARLQAARPCQRSRRASAYTMFGTEEALLCAAALVPCVQPRGRSQGRPGGRLPGACSVAAAPRLSTGSQPSKSASQAAAPRTARPPSEQTRRARPAARPQAGQALSACPSAHPGVSGRELFRQPGLLGAGRASRTQAGAADARVRADLCKVADRQDGLRRLRRQLPRRRQDERLHPAAARRGARQLQGSHGVGLGPCAARQRARPARVRSPLPRRQQARTPWRAESSQPAPAPDSGPAQRGSGAGGGAAARLQQPACGRAGQRARRPRLCSRVRRAASQCGTDEAQAEGATRCSGPRLHKLPACAPGTLRGWLAWGARQAPSVRRATQPWR